MSDTETPDTPDEHAPAPGGSAIVDMVKAEVAEHPTVFSAEAEGPMLPGQEHEHATPFEYVVIAVILCAITAFEIFLYYQEESWSHSLIVGLLLPLSFVKFLIVASYYMHLKSDKPVYRRFFIGAGLLAFFVFFVALSSIGARLDAPALWGMLGIVVVAVVLFVSTFVMKATRKT